MTDRAPLFLVLVVGASALLSRCSHASAQPDDVMIARLVVHEAGLDSPADADAIVAVLLNGAARHEMTPRAFARAYAPRFTRRLTSRPWVHRLDARGTDPRAGVRWSLYRARWLALVTRCGVALLLPPVCAATDWSSPSHRRRRVSEGRAFAPVDCGPTLNAYAVRS